jgi:hypothetical protein
MILTDALPTSLPPAPSSSNSALPRRRDGRDAPDDRHARPTLPASAPPPSTASASPGASQAALGAVARGRPPSPFIGAATIVAMQWVVFGSAVARWLVF